MNRRETFELAEELLDLELPEWEKRFLEHLIDRRESGAHVNCGHRSTLIALAEKYKKALDMEEWNV